MTEAPVQRLPGVPRALLSVLLLFALASCLCPGRPYRRPSQEEWSVVQGGVDVASAFVRENGYTSEAADPSRLVLEDVAAVREGDPKMWKEILASRAGELEAHPFAFVWGGVTDEFHLAVLFRYCLKWKKHWSLPLFKEETDATLRAVLVNKTDTGWKVRIDHTDWRTWKADRFLIDPNSGPYGKCD